MKKIKIYKESHNRYWFSKKSTYLFGLIQGGYKAVTDNFGDAPLIFRSIQGVKDYCYVVFGDCDYEYIDLEY